MGYVSIEFLCLLVVTLLIFYLWPKKITKYRHLVLLTASYVFIAFGDWRWALIVIFNTVVSYVCGILTFQKKTIPSKDYSYVQQGVFQIPSAEPSKTEVTKKYVLPVAISILINVGFLVAVKYTNWLGNSIADVLKKPFDPINFIVPLGISFYVFTLVAYNVDVYKGKVSAEKNFLKFATFVSFFPKLAEGPITRYSEMKDGGLFGSERFSDVDFYKPFQRIVLGIAKKALVADILGVYVTYIWSNYTSLPGYLFPIVAILYAVQLFCDFSGYMDMSIGVAGLFGIRMPENFNVPYLSKTVQEFWRRWHITLGTWLRDYIYFPLGGSRVKQWRIVFNLMVVWIVSGLWHGADWTYLIWGIYFGILLVISHLGRNYCKEKWGKYNGKLANGLRVFRTFTLVTIGWSIFSAPSLDSFIGFVKRFIKHTFEGSAGDIFNESTLPSYYLIVALAVAALLVVIYYIKQVHISLPKFTNSSYFRVPTYFAVVCTVMVVTVYMTIILKGIGVSTSDFIYFDF